MTLIAVEPASVTLLGKSRKSKRTKSNTTTIPIMRFIRPKNLITNVPKKIYNYIKK